MTIAIIVLSGLLVGSMMVNWALLNRLLMKASVEPVQLPKIKEEPPGENFHESGKQRRVFGVKVGV